MAEPTQYTTVISEEQLIGILSGKKISMGGMLETAKIIDIEFDNEKSEIRIIPTLSKDDSSR